MGSSVIDSESNSVQGEKIGREGGECRREGGWEEERGEERGR